MEIESFSLFLKNLPIVVFVMALLLAYYVYQKNLYQFGLF
jgi:hypothetical protein